MTGPSIDDLSRCVHCGFCLQHCPTYVATGLETESPRGRLYLMRALAEGRIEATSNVVTHLEQCLLCRNCETVCPSSVPYGRIMQAQRAVLHQTNRGGLTQRLMRWLVFRALLPHPGRLRALAVLPRFYQWSRLRQALHATKLTSLLPRRLQAMEALLPATSAPPYPPLGLIAAATGPRRGRVALLAGCVMPMVTPQTHAATVRVLTRNGYDVVAPANQTCCGALHTHSGDVAGAQALARRNIDAFLAAAVDAVVVNAAGCGAEMKGYGDLLRDDSEYAARAATFAAQVADITEFLAREGFTAPLGALPLRVTYQDSCHLAHAQRITSAPRELLAAIPGLQLVEMPHADRCCGSAGVYNLEHPALAGQILAAKVKDVAATGATVVATANPGCMLQLAQGMAAGGVRARVVHVVELVDQAQQAVEAQR
jgi:glycolate oxidase iron-sulfur subunit